VKNKYHLTDLPRTILSFWTNTSTSREKDSAGLAAFLGRVIQRALTAGVLWTFSLPITPSITVHAAADQDIEPVPPHPFLTTYKRLAGR
jgi:hypothetical protein